jgi:exosortase
VNPDSDDVRPSGAFRRLLFVHACCLACWLLTIATFWRPLREVLQLSLHDGRYSHLFVIPFISACLIYWNRRAIFRSTAYAPRIGIPLVLAVGTAGWYLASRYLNANGGYRLSVAVLAILSIWAAGFLLFYGLPSLRPARFPLLFMLLMIPIPPVVIERIILLLQMGTSGLVYGLFQLAGTPLVRQGFSFELPGVGLEITKESSSINSAWALFITGLLVGHFFLKRFPAKAILSLLTVPIAVLTNSIRIVTVWFLATHIDASFLNGNLHRNGGIFFSVISLFLLIVSLWLLRKLENRRRSPA